MRSCVEMCYKNSLKRSRCFPIAVYLFIVEHGGRIVFEAPNGRFLAWSTKHQYWGVVDSYPSDSFYAQNKVLKSVNHFCKFFKNTNKCFLALTLT